MSDIDWEQVQQEDRLYPWLSDPGPEVVEEMDDYPWEEQ